MNRLFPRPFEFIAVSVLLMSPPFSSATPSPLAGGDDIVDRSTLTGKVLCGYQGWFAAAGDGSGRGWVHYGETPSLLEPGHCTFDLWPDLAEMDPDEKFATSFLHADGSTAHLFSPYLRKTVVRHFQWMRRHGIDGVFLQRFGTDLRTAQARNHRNVVLGNVRAAAAETGRAWVIMYDLSGLGPGEIHSIIMKDWKWLVDTVRIRTDPAYLHHDGKPLVAVWGVGFSDGRRYTLEECEELVLFLRDDPVYGDNAVMLGVPTYWRTLDRDAVADPKLHEIIATADIVSPWSVGRFDSPAGARAYAAQTVAPDIAWANDRGLDYLPVVFPGFSWHNLMKARGKSAPLDQIPRLGGRFLWTQAVSLKNAGAEMLYVAMFDEIDEGTAIFKCTNDPPVGESPFLTYEGLPTDQYLWLAGEIGRMLRGEIPPAPEMPQRPGESNSLSLR